MTAKQHWKAEWNKWAPTKLKKWSPKVNDPRQGDLIEHLNRKDLREGFARLDEAIKKSGGKP